jgi:EmrB/QacA subfamily drug resistance transporter
MDSRNINKTTAQVYPQTKSGNGTGNGVVPNGAHPPGEPAEEEWQTRSKGQIIVVMISVMLGILLAALDQTIVGPALPKIIGDLNGFDQYSWVVTVYLLTSTISVPIIGKLSDMYGRKWFYMAGIVIFLLGSALSGLSANMTELIIYRGIQGLGAGILFACAFTIIADLIPPADRGKWQGLFGAVFGLSSVIGPTLGGFITDNFSWHWVFYVNVPIGLVALAVLYFTFPHEPKHNVHKSVDWAGATLLTLTLVPVLVALSLGGTPDWDWGSAKVIGMFVAGAVFLAAFLYTESRVKEPIISLDLFKNSIFTSANIALFLTGVGLFGAVLYIPLFIQAIQGDSATSSGNAVTPMTLAIVVSSIVVDQLVSRTGKYKIITIIGMGTMVVGMFLLYTMSADTPRFTTILYMIIMGLGLGIPFSILTLAVQNSVAFKNVGAATSATQFFRSMGGTVGVAILGTVVNNQFHSRFGPELQKAVDTLGPQASANIPVAQLTAALSNINPQALVSVQGADQLRSQIAHFIPAGAPANSVDVLMDVITKALKPALFSGIQEAFLIGSILLAMGFVAALFLKEIPLRKGASRGGSAMSEGGPVTTSEELTEIGDELAQSGLPGATTLAEDEEPRPQFSQARTE